MTEQVDQVSQTETDTPKVEDKTAEVNVNFNLPNDHPALKELNKVRREAAGQRVTINDFKSKAEKWDDYELSQKTELEKLSDERDSLKGRVSALEAETARQTIANEFKLDAELAALLTGTDDEMRSKAKVLADKFGATSGQSASTGRPDLRGGSRGTPVVPQPKAGGQFLLGLANQE